MPEVTLGKRCVRLDLRRPHDRTVFDDLLAQADVLVHGYRPAALERLGYGDAMRRQPVPLPVQALDHATGYLMAAAVVHALLGRLTEGRAMQARRSLARTAKLLADAPAPSVDTPLAATRDDDFLPQLEQTEWGAARRYRPPVIIDGAPMRWDLPASSLGGAKANWLPCNSDRMVPASGD